MTTKEQDAAARLLQRLANLVGLGEAKLHEVEFRNEVEHHVEEGSPDNPTGLVVEEVGQDWVLTIRTREADTFALEAFADFAFRKSGGRRCT